MAAKWYYKIMGEEFGPISGSELRQAAQNGIISSDSLIKEGVDGDWVLAERVKCLFEPVRRSSPRATKRDQEDAHDSSRQFTADYKSIVQAALTEHLPYPHVHQDQIPTKKAANARKSCGLRPDETLIALIDCTMLGSAKNCLAFTQNAVYFHNSGDKEGFRIPYSDFPSRFFGSGGPQEIHLGRDQFLNVSFCSVSESDIIESLDDIRKRIADIQPPRSKEMLLLGVLGHPRHKSFLKEFLTPGLRSEEYWSILISTQRVLLVLENKSHARAVIGALTGGIGGYFLSPLADAVAKPRDNVTENEAIDDEEFLTEEAISRIRQSSNKHIEFSISEGVERYVKDEAGGRLSLYFPDGSITFGEKEFITADNAAYKGSQFIEFEHRGATYLFPGLAEYEASIARCQAALLQKGGGLDSRLDRNSLHTDKHKSDL